MGINIVFAFRSVYQIQSKVLQLCLENMKNNASFVYAILLILGDFLALLAAFSLAYVLRVEFDTRPLIAQIPAGTYFWAFATVLPTWILVHAFIGLYSHEIYEKRFSELGRLFVGSFLGILVLIGYDFVSKESLFPARLVPVYGLLLGFVFLVVFRNLIRLLRRQLFKYGFGISNVLIIGNTDASKNMAEVMSDTKHSGQSVLGVVGKQLDGFEYFADFTEALGKISRPIHAIVQTELYKDQDKNNDILKYAQEHHAAYRFIPGNSDLFVGNIEVELFGGLPVIAVHQTALIGWGRIVKRLFDLAFGSLVFIATLPLTVLIMLFMKIFGSRGPIFFRQVRLTRFNRKFTVYKFRTIKGRYNGLSPEQAFKEMGKPNLAKEYRDNGDYLPNDPRISTIGRFLRRTSLDELPQLINVLKGDLSLVGPRALIPPELTAYEKHHAILSVKSGLTGLAQISGRRDISFEERRRLDVYYVQNWSFWLDVVILLKTLRVVIFGTGAK